jgi:multicomponent Na+:H+ antiporter subunit G
MDLLRETTSWICLAAGSCFAVIGGIGILRLPDFYTRLHGGGITDTLGAGLILTGLMLQSGMSLTTVKLLMILVFLLICSPTSCHALAQSAVIEGLRPLLAEKPEE